LDLATATGTATTIETEIRRLSYRKTAITIEIEIEIRR
jgi:hypothetical protein